MSTTLAPKRRLPGTKPSVSPSANRQSASGQVQRILQTLRQSPYSAHRRLCVLEEQGQIVLQGQVESYFHKQMAQELARRCWPQAKIDNRIEVCYRGF